MKRAYTNGILLDGTEQMEPVRGKVLLTENDKISRHCRCECKP